MAHKRSCPATCTTTRVCEAIRAQGKRLAALPNPPAPKVARKPTLDTRLTTLEEQQRILQVSLGDLRKTVEDIVTFLDGSIARQVGKHSTVEQPVVQPDEQPDEQPVAPVVQPDEPTVQPDDGSAQNVLTSQPVHTPPSIQDARKRANAACAAHLREMGVVPVGQALQAAKEGERDRITLLALNVADGIGLHQVTVTQL